MKIELKVEELDDCRQCVTLLVDDSEIACFCDGEPEDNTIARNFNDILKIGDLMRLAYQAGVEGLGLEVV